MSRSNGDAPPETLHLDWERLDLWAKEPGSPSFVAELAQIFLDDLPARLEKLQGLLVPLQKEAAQRAAHAVKGAARNFGAVHMANLAEEIERTLAAPGQDAAIVLCEALHREFEIVRGLLDPVLGRSQSPAAELSGSRPTTGASESDAEKHAPQD